MVRYNNSQALNVSRALLPALLAAALLLSSCGAPAMPQQATLNTQPPTITGPLAEVMIDDMGYYPRIITVSAGTTVCWYNPEYDDHTVTSDSALFDNYMIACSGPFCFTFFFPGRYTYHDAMYPDFQGTIIVE